VCESAVFISGDLVHDAHAVEHFTRTYEEYLKEGGVEIEKEVMFSDGCAAQYKSKLPFYFLSKRGSKFELILVQDMARALVMGSEES